MGTYAHKAIVVTSFQWNELEEARIKAINTFGKKMVSTTVSSEYNGFRSFLIGPDGSKEERDESDHYDNLRSSYIKYLQSFAYEDGGNPLEFSEVNYAYH
jgi:hypothetical protein